MRAVLNRILRGTGRVVAQAGRVVSTVLVGMDGRPLPPAPGSTAPEEHRPST